MDLSNTLLAWQRRKKNEARQREIRDALRQMKAEDGHQIIDEGTAPDNRTRA